MGRGENLKNKITEYWSYQKKNWEILLFSGYNKRKYAQILYERELDIVTNWGTKWKTQEVSFYDSSGNVTASTEGLKFSDWIIAEFYFLDSGAKYNKNKNFCMKFFSLVVFIAAYIGLIYLYLKLFNNEILTALSIVMIVPSYMVSRWIDIKKYQETWSRYTAIRTDLLQEMVKYLYDQQPYDKIDKNIQFMNKMLELSKQNIDNFQSNMKKEKGLAVSKWKELLFR